MNSTSTTYCSIVVLLLHTGLAFTRYPVNANGYQEIKTYWENKTLMQGNITNSQNWHLMTKENEELAWRYILNSPLGIAALNQLAIEGFISPKCPKTFYVNEISSGYQILLQVTCPTSRGVSIARGYKEIQVIFDRFEDNIENYQIRRIFTEE